MHIWVWNDYICPWAYASRPQTEWVRAQTVGNGSTPPTVEIRAFELHPDLPAEGRSIRPGGRYDQVLDRVASECAARDHEFVKPTHTPNGRLALAAAEFVRVRHPEAFDAFDRALARAYWVEGQDIGDRSVIESIAEVAGPPSPITANDFEEGASILDESRQAALEVGATATPSWQFGDFVLIGLHDDAQFQRWVGRILDRAG